MITTSIIAQSTGPIQIEDTFLKRDGVIAYSGRGWSVRSEGDIGWASLKVGADEFLYRTATLGGFLFSDQNPQSPPPLFPDKSNISHDRMLASAVCRLPARRVPARVGTFLCLRDQVLSIATGSCRLQSTAIDYIPVRGEIVCEQLFRPAPEATPATSAQRSSAWLSAALILPPNLSP